MKKGREGRDGVYEFGTSGAWLSIKSWKRSYFRKNSKKSCKIICRCWHSPEHDIFWKYYLELHRSDKMIHQDRITSETYDTLTKNKNLVRTDSGGVEFVTLETFNPIANEVN